MTKGGPLEELSGSGLSWHAGLRRGCVPDEDGNFEARLVEMVQGRYLTGPAIIDLGSWDSLIYDCSCP